MSNHVKQCFFAYLYIHFDRHSLLFDYGLNSEEFSADDADANLVPHLVEKVALPILHHQVANCWDVLSTAETKNAVSASSLIATYDLASSQAFSELLVVVRKRLAEVVADLVVIMLILFLLSFEFITAFFFVVRVN